MSAACGSCYTNILHLRSYIRDHSSDLRRNIHIDNLLSSVPGFTDIIDRGYLRLVKSVVMDSLLASKSPAVPVIDLDNLQHMATQIRDHFDPLIAREGPDIMHPDDVLILHELFRHLQTQKLDVAIIAASRIHKAVQEVSGKATRWPHKLAEECDKVRSKHSM